MVSLAFPPSPLLSLAFSCLPLPALSYHIGTCLKSDRASRSLLRQVFFKGPGGTFFEFFRRSFLTSFFDGFLVDFGGVWEAKIAPKIDFWSDFLDVF